MIAAFDDSAASYDTDFTNTSIGRLQRNQVWQYLENNFVHECPGHVLELNCGTGEDALFFARKGCNVLATDVSMKMLECTREKISREAMEHLVTVQHLDLSAMNRFIPSHSFDLVFSDFGGLNCISADALQHVLEWCSNHMQPGGRVIMVIMPRYCAWELLYYTAKLRWGTAWRRSKNNVAMAAIGNNVQPVWYHSPGTVARMASPRFIVKKIIPVGIALPPSYLQHLFNRRPGLLTRLNRWENTLNRYKSLAGMADHYLIDLQLT